jgi:hypothetical protein
MHVSSILEEIKDLDLFFHFEQQHVDWTDNQKVNLIIHSPYKKYNIELLDEKSIEKFAASFCFYTKNCKLISWNLKNIISFFTKKASINLEFDEIYDLSILCSYFDLPKKIPNSCKDAFYLLNFIKSTNSWNVFSDFYKQIYDPLIKKVIPEIENNCLVDKNKRKFVYSYYEIEGQSNGRLKNLKILKDCYIPHNMDIQEKQNLRLPNYDEVFLYFDYKHMEVSVLEWISKDKNLSEILNSDGDLYEVIWETLTKTKASSDQRKLCKNIFLPVIFGQGSNSLSKKLEITEKNAKEIIYKLNQAFPVAFTWINSQVSDCNNFATDLFGRRRKFEENEFYKIRNFCIQSPANMICLRKLANLYEILDNKAKIRFHIHDGYCISCKKKDIKHVYEISKKTLEEGDSLFPDLKLKVSCEFGEDLSKLKNIKEVL